MAGNEQAGKGENSFKVMWTDSCSLGTYSFSPFRILTETNMCLFEWSTLSPPCIFFPFPLLELLCGQHLRPSTQSKAVKINPSS